ncbi:MAG TPA: glycosyltransferase [Candidatus Angelobacter sp.]
MIRPPDHSILYVSYPLLTVSDKSAGGAEQMLWTLEREMAKRGARTTVAASAGSQVSGELFITGEPCSVPDDFERRNREHQDRVLEFVRTRSRQGRPLDLVHDQSGSFWPRAAEIDVPVLATLHLPRNFYAAQLFANIPENMVFNCVSESQARSFAGLNPAVVPNGIALDSFEPNPGRRKGTLWLGRICEEKAPHLALEIAARAGQPITLAGQVYPFSYHQQYFEREVRSRLAQMPNAEFVSTPPAEHKRRLLRESGAVLITNLVDETSSLVAMEAAASGTPVIAFRRGALPEIVSEGVTGFLVDGVEDAIKALGKIETIDPADCVARAEGVFSSDKMADRYAQLYGEIVAQQARDAVPITGSSDLPITR